MQKNEIVPNGMGVSCCMDFYFSRHVMFASENDGSSSENKIAFHFKINFVVFGQK